MNDGRIYSCSGTEQCKRCLQFTGNNPALIKDGLCASCNKEIYDKTHGFTNVKD